MTLVRAALIGSIAIAGCIAEGSELLTEQNVILLANKVTQEVGGLDPLLLGLGGGVLVPRAHSRQPAASAAGQGIPPKSSSPRRTASSYLRSKRDRAAHPCGSSTQRAARRASACGGAAFCRGHRPAALCR